MVKEIIIVGGGNQGKKHLLNIPDDYTVTVIDYSQIKLNECKKLRSDIFTCKSVEAYEKLNNTDEKLVIIAVTIPNLYSITKRCLLNLTNVKAIITEKPGAQTAEQLNELYNIAEDKKILLRIGYTESWKPCFNYALKLLMNKEVSGKIKYISMQRFSTAKGLIKRLDLDLISHDLNNLLILAETIDTQFILYPTGTVNERLITLVTQDKILGNMFTSYDMPYAKRFIEIITTKISIKIDLMNDFCWVESQNPELNFVAPMNKFNNNALENQIINTITKANKNDTRNNIIEMSRNIKILELIENGNFK